MRQFDCLAKEIPLLGPHFLEASAGTGKTFAIEHITARLILNRFDLEQILVVTFTRAAARELKLRIRTNLEAILSGASWDYLPIDKRSIADALSSFDRAQIYTIHGFCSRMLKEYAFEIGLSFNMEENAAVARDAALRDFFEMQMTEEILSPAQLDILLRWAGSVEDLARQLKKGEKPVSAATYKQRSEACKAALHGWTGPIEVDLELYKKMDGDFAGQLEALRNGCLDKLISDETSIFEYVSPENKKVKARDVPCSPFAIWGREHLFPIIEKMRDPKEILNAVLAIWKPIEEKVLLEAGSFGPDEILRVMQEAIRSERFLKKIQTKYRAVLIDEFQDTDPVQWDIFNTLFSNSEALYLIGDPKQSIYRFRKADLYTYLKAKDSIGPEGQFYLDTNFRSSKQLIGALNALFDRQWLHLPQQKKTLPYLPVRAGLELATDFGDGKGAVHCVRLDKELLYSYVVQQAQQFPPQSVAVLVNSRFQAAEMQKAFAEANIPSVARSQEILTDTLAFQAVVELFDALRHPRHLGKAKVVLAGPFGGYSADKLLTVETSPFIEWRKRLDEKGLAVFCQSLKNVGPEYLQVFEVLFEWERNVGFSFEGLFRYFDTLRQMDPDEAICARKETETDAVQIMTMHVSKGLEFDIVFAIGLGSRTPEGDEEAEAEKLRQLYVAMTRAKRRLYIPIPFEAKEAKMGTASPIELFCRALSPDGKWEEELQRVAAETSLTIEVVSEVHVVPNAAPMPLSAAPKYKIPPYQTSHLLSFTALAQETAQEPLAPMPEVNGSYSAQNLPRGSETGVIIHRIFERIFSEKTEPATIVAQELGSLMPWKEAVIEMVQKTLALDVLRDIQNARVETEFLFQDGLNYLKGFIDLLFVRDNKLFFVDWKTNWLESYEPEALEVALRAGQYDLQASIYAEALSRQWEGEIGGAIYIFVRGPSAIHFQPGKYSWNN